MKKYFQIIVFVVAMFGVSFSAFACSCSNFDPNQRKAFKKAETVFIGEVLDVSLESHPNSEISRSLSGLVKFKVEKSWKNKVEEIEVWLDRGSEICYPIPSVSKKYLIYAYAFENVITDKKYKDILVFGLFCSRSKVYDIDDKEIQKEVKKLNSFWFRFWAKIYPF